MMRAGCLTILLLLAAVSASAQEQTAALDTCIAGLHSASGADACLVELLSITTEPLVRAEAFLALGDRQRAHREFRAAVRVGDSATVRTRWGMLYLAAHQYADAESMFQQALALAPGDPAALTGQALVALWGFDARARELAGAALARDPNHADAHFVVARLDIESGDTDAARARLLPLTEPSIPRLARLEAMALLASADRLEGIEASVWTTRVLDLAPKYGDVYRLPAHFLVLLRRYEEAVELLRLAVGIDADNYAAHAALGANLLRINRMAEGREHLEAAWQGDRFNAEVVNMLRLMDTLQGFDELRGDGHLLRLHPAESAVLGPLMVKAINRAAVGMAERYDLDLERPVVVEMYRRHDDFAVRTAGLPGIGILGAAFGDVVVMDGPSAQPADYFDWYSALWHEIAHVYTLNATNNRISRWFSEGISMLEEWRHGPSQRESVSMTFLQAYSEGKLLPIAELENGFIRPVYQGQVEVSYVQSGLVCLMIGDHWPEGIVAMLKVYRDGGDTEDAVREGLGIEPAELDERFADWLQVRFVDLGRDFDGYMALRRETHGALSESDWETALVRAQASVAKYPAFVGDGSPWLEVALAANKLGRTDLAREALVEYWQRGGRNTAALDELSGTLEPAEPTLTDILQTLSQLDPLREERHIRLAEHSESQGDLTRALAARQAVLALGPYDTAGARYEVARLLFELGRMDDARRQVLEALEVAPRYREALNLLLEIET